MDNNVLAVLIFIGLFIICFIWEILKRKADAALNRNVFNRGTYKAQQELTDGKFTYPCQAGWSTVRPLLETSPLGDNLQISKEGPNGIQWVYRAFHLHTISEGEFTAYLELDEQSHIATFEFIRWTNADGVVRHLEQMQQLKSWVEDVIAQANRTATTV